MKKELFEEEKKIWYSKFYDLEVEGTREEDEAFLAGPMDAKKHVRLKMYWIF